MSSDMDTPPLFDFPSIWREVRTELLRGQSVLLSAPRHFGKKYFCARLPKDELICANYVIALINPEPATSHAAVFRKIWKDVALQLAAGGIPLSGGFSFEEDLLNIRSPKKILFIIRLSSRNKDICIKLLNLFQQLSHHHPSAFMKNVAVLTLDDLSLYFYETSIRNQRSFYDIFESRKKIFQYTDIIPINNLLKTIPGYARQAPSFSNIILQLTGGHLGLLYHLLSVIVQKENGGPTDNFEAYCREILMNSSIIDSVKRVLLQERNESLKMALAFKEKQLTDMESGEVIERLHHAGILLRVNSLYSVLCPGVICELAEQLYSNKVRHSAAGPVVSVPAAVSPGYQTCIRREIFFSYAHGKGNGLIDRLYNELAAHPRIRPIMDRKDLPYRELISTFMLRIGEGNFVVVAFSDKYLKSIYCMFEFYELYRNSNLDGNRLVKKIYPIRIGKLSLTDLTVMSGYLNHWAAELEKWDQFIKIQGNRINASNHKEYDKVRSICNHLGELLEIIKDINTLNIKSLSKNNFAVIKEAIGGMADCPACDGG